MSTLEERMNSKFLENDFCLSKKSDIFMENCWQSTDHVRITSSENNLLFLKNCQFPNKLHLDHPSTHTTSIRRR